MQVKVKYFASLRECTGISSETVECASNLVEDVYIQLNDRYKFPIEKSLLRVAINEEYANFNDTLSDGDTLVFITPVAGG